MTEIILSPFLQVLFDRVVSPAVLEIFEAKKLDDGLLRKLEMTLLSVNKVLDDAEVKQITDKYVKEWLEELQDALYDAEDLLDAVNTEAMQLQLENKLNVANIFGSSTHAGEMETKLKVILERLEDIVGDKDDLGLKEGIGTAEKPHKRLPTTSLVGENTVYGREDAKESILNLLLAEDSIVELLLAEDSSDDPLGVIAIKGMGGLGKTTLAQLVYNDNKVVQHFDFKAWVCISEEFDVFKVAGSILRAVTSSNSVIHNLDLLLVELKNNLADKKFFLVLDDVWNEDPKRWEMLKRPLQHGAKGSRILLTTRNEGVAQLMRTVVAYSLEKLSREDCWELFANYAFEGGESQPHQSFIDMGREIVKKCDRLPLAAKALGSLLRHKKTIEEWSKIMKSNMWDLEDKCNIISVLRVSYHYLSARLKCCFAFASIFPKGYLFEKDELILLWAAQSFFPEGVNVEDIGGKYFNELISRSFFQRLTADSSLFVMHDIMHDLATSVAGQSCRCCVNLEDIREITNTTRHMSYFKRSLKQFWTLPATNNTLRTFTQLKEYIRATPPKFCPDEISDVLLKRFKLLRVLSLREYDIKVLPETIGSLKHLRYFDLSGTAIERLPNSTCDLYNLQTLMLTACSNLIELPTDTWKLVNLQYVDVTDCYRLRKMPSILGRLKNHAILGKFDAGKDSIGELGQLLSLGGQYRRAQSISGPQIVASGADAAEARLKGKNFKKLGNSILNKAFGLEGVYRRVIDGWEREIKGWEVMGREEKSIQKSYPCL